MTTAHEPRRGPGTHLSTEDLSALAEGAQPSAAGAAEHLLECAACRGEVDAISELLAQFEMWDAPAIPQEVAIRIDAALARESAARAQAAGSGIGEKADRARASTSPAEALVPSRTTTNVRRRRRFPVQGLGWALASLVVIAGGLGLILKVASSSSQSEGASTASGSTAQRNAAPYNANPGLGGAETAPTMVASSSLLATWTTQALSSHRSAYGESAGSLCGSADPAYANHQLLAMTTGPYEGTPSMLVVYANPNDPSTVLAVVYATPCTAANYHVLASGLVAK